MWACALALVSVYPEGARATGGGYIDDGTTYFFAPEIIDRPDDLSFDSGEGTLPDELLEKVNRKEWSTYFRSKVSDANLNFLIYKMPLGDLDKIIWILEGKKTPNLSKETAAVKAELDAVGDKGQVLRALYYLGFAKRCEPIATRGLAHDSWDTEKTKAARLRDAETAGKLLSASEGLVAATKDKFLQDRYRFQRLRLMFYTGRHTEAQSYYDANIGALTTESSIKYRFMHTAAGSLYHLQSYGPANYLYSVVFDHFAPLKRSSYLSFRPVEEADWQQSLSMAKNNRERAVIWQMLGVYADGLAAIEKIYAMTPDSDLLPLLLVREVNRAEGEWSRNVAKRKDGVGSGAAETRSDVAAIGKKRLALIKRIADAQKTFKPYLWQLALGHLYTLAGDTQAALANLDLAEQSVPKGSNAAAQLRLSRLMARVRSMKAIDKAQEPYLAAELAWTHTGIGLQSADVRSWTLKRLSQLYKKAGDSLRAQMLGTELPPTGAKQLVADSQKIDQILAFAAQPGKSAFDEFIANNYFYSYRRESLFELKMLNELYAGRYQSAVDLLALGGDSVNKNPLGADPFVIHNLDCHDCDFEAKRAVTYTKASFIKKLLELSQKAQGTGAAAAQASFELANGLYNMSYYGNARDVYTPSQGGWPECPGKAPNCRMDFAEKYYKRAMELSTDKEFKARACFMAAKTEQNRFINSQPIHSVEPTKNPGESHSPVYFKKLKDSFSDTRYYQEIIKECSYFRSYLGKK